MHKRTVKLHSGSVEITEGVLDSSSEYVFSRGHCHSLALAIARARNLNVVVVGRDHTQTRMGGPFDPMHVLVELAPGQWADVRGVHSPAMIQTFERVVPYKVPAAAKVVSPDELGPILDGGSDDWFAEDPLLAASFIEPLLERWGVEVSHDDPAIPQPGPEL